MRGHTLPSRAPQKKRKRDVGDVGDNGSEPPSSGHCGRALSFGSFDPGEVIIVSDSDDEFPVALSPLVPRRQRQPSPALSRPESPTAVSSPSTPRTSTRRKVKGRARMPGSSASAPRPPKSISGLAWALSVNAVTSCSRHIPHGLTFFQRSAHNVQPNSSEDWKGKTSTSKS